MKDIHTPVYMARGLLNVLDPWNFALRRPYKAKDEYGVFLCADPLATIQFQHGYEKEVRAVVESVPKGGLFIDAGANIGKYSVMAAKRGLTVYALEPDPRAWYLLEYNLALNKCENYFALPYAAWNEETTLPYYSSPHYDLGGMRPNDVHGTPLTLGPPTRCIPLGQLPFEPWENVLVKIDTEGTTFEVLEGAKRILKGRKARFVFESLTSDDLWKNSRLVELFGYSVKQLNRTNFLAVPP